MDSDTHVFGLELNDRVVVYDPRTLGVKDQTWLVRVCCEVGLIRKVSVKGLVDSYFFYNFFNWLSFRLKIPHKDFS